MAPIASGVERTALPGETGQVTLYRLVFIGSDVGDLDMIIQSSAQRVLPETKWS